MGDAVMAKLAAELTEYERLMVCVSAGVPYEVFHEVRKGSYFLTMRTLVPCAVTDNPEGGYFVASRSMKKEPRIGCGATGGPGPGGDDNCTDPWII